MLTSSQNEYLFGGGYTEKLEQKLNELYESSFALTCDSATNAIGYVLTAYQLQGCEILTTPITFGGTLAATLHMGCKFHFADVDNNLCIEPTSVESILKVNPDIKAVIAVDFCGNPHQARKIDTVCKKYGVKHICDAAQSFGKSVKNAAKHNDAVILSFGEGKGMIGCGGGAVITNSKSLYRNLLKVCQHPYRQEKELGINKSVEFSYSGRINAKAAESCYNGFQMSLENIAKRREEYLKLLKDFRKIDKIKVLASDDSTFFNCPIQITDIQSFNESVTGLTIDCEWELSKARLKSIPMQLRSAGYKERILSFPSEKHISKIINNLYYLFKL